MRSGFAVLHGCADASALAKKGFRQSKAPSTFPIENLSEMFCFIQSTIIGEEALHVEENVHFETFWTMPLLPL